MELLQPSRFTDILALPGGRTKDPALGGVNQARLREVGVSSDDYDISSLGTAFSCQRGTNQHGCQHATRAGEPVKAITITTGTARAKGVDMRMVSTDFIESVEVIRGIPSVEYGELTSGVIKIQRKAGAHPWEARIKSDPESKLVYLGKGFATNKGWIFNFGFDYLDAEIDPRNNLEKLQTSLRNHPRGTCVENKHPVIIMGFGLGLRAIH